MKNQSMKRKLETGEAVSLSANPRTPEGFIILSMEPHPGDDGDWKDYCLADAEEWIWWIALLKDGRVVAGTDPKQSPVDVRAWLWLR